MKAYLLYISWTWIHDRQWTLRVLLLYLHCILERIFLLNCNIKFESYDEDQRQCTNCKQSCRSIGMNLSLTLNRHSNSLAQHKHQPWLKTIVPSFQIMKMPKPAIINPHSCKVARKFVRLLKSERAPKCRWSAFLKRARRFSSRSFSKSSLEINGFKPAQASSSKSSPTSLSKQRRIWGINHHSHQTSRSTVVLNSLSLAYCQEYLSHALATNLMRIMFIWMRRKRELFQPKMILKLRKKCLMRRIRLRQRGLWASKSLNQLTREGCQRRDHLSSMRAQRTAALFHQPKRETRRLCQRTNSVSWAALSTTLII